jgi:hypothetical protein
MSGGDLVVFNPKLLYQATIRKLGSTATVYYAVTEISCCFRTISCRRNGIWVDRR